jgi:hypothetical protein
MFSTNVPDQGDKHSMKSIGTSVSNVTWTIYILEASGSTLNRQITNVTSFHRCPHLFRNSLPIFVIYLFIYLFKDNINISDYIMSIGWMIVNW